MEEHQPSLEGQIVCVADRLAYYLHDLEDAIGKGLVGEAELVEVTLWREAAQSVRREHGDLSLPAARRSVLERILNRCCADVVAEAHGRLAAAGARSPDELRRMPEPAAAFSDAVSAELASLEQFLGARVYHHPDVATRDERAIATVDGLFASYADHPSRLPSRFSKRIDDQGLERVVCDYVAGMTDRFCQDEFARLCGPIRQ